EAATRQDVLDGGAAVEHTSDAGILWQVAEGARAQHAARYGGGGPAQHPQQARLAGAVPTDQPYLVPGADGEGGARDDQAPPDLHIEPMDAKHGRPGWQDGRLFTTQYGQSRCGCARSTPSPAGGARAAA